MRAMQMSKGTVVDCFYSHFIKIYNHYNAIEIKIDRIRYQSHCCLMNIYHSFLQKIHF